MEEDSKRDIQIEKVTDAVTEAAKKYQIKDIDRLTKLALYHMDVNKALKEYKKLTEADRELGRVTAPKKTRKSKSVDKGIKDSNRAKKSEIDAAYILENSSHNYKRLTEDNKELMNKLVCKCGKAGGFNSLLNIIDILSIIEDKDIMIATQEFLNKLSTQTYIGDFRSALPLYFRHMIKRYENKIIAEITEYVSRTINNSKRQANMEYIRESETYNNLSKLYENNINMFNRVAVRELSYSIKSVIVAESRRNYAIAEQKAKTINIREKRTVKKEVQRLGRKGTEINEITVGTSEADLMRTMDLLRLNLDTPLRFSRESNTRLYDKINLIVPMKFVELALMRNITVLEVLFKMLKDKDKGMRYFTVKYMVGKTGNIGDTIGIVATEINIPNIDLFNNYSDRGLYALLYTVYKHWYK